MCLTHWGQNKNGGQFTIIFKPIFFNEKKYIWFRFNWNLFIRFQLTICQHMADLDRNTILRTYRYIKWSIKIEPYLYLVKDHRYRHAIAQLRKSSHILHIERGRYTEPRTPVNERLCTLCNCVEDELHFVTACTINRTERKIMYDKICLKFPEFSQLNDEENLFFCLHFLMPKRYLGFENTCINPSEYPHVSAVICVTMCSHAFARRLVVFNLTREAMF